MMIVKDGQGCGSGPIGMGRAAIDTPTHHFQHPCLQSNPSKPAQSLPTGTTSLQTSSPLTRPQNPPPATPPRQTSLSTPAQPEDSPLLCLNQWTVRPYSRSILRS